VRLKTTTPSITDKLEICLSLYLEIITGCAQMYAISPCEFMMNMRQMYPKIAFKLANNFCDKCGQT
jgi:hypothetical protein